MSENTTADVLCVLLDGGHLDWSEVANNSDYKVWDFYGTPLRVVDSKLLSALTDSYGYIPPGVTDEVYMVFRLGEGTEARYFKKEGTADSYDDIQWNGAFSEVRAQQKTFYVYE